MKALCGPAVAAFLAAVGPTVAVADDPGNLKFHQTWVEAQQRDLAVEEPMVLFAQIFAALPKQITVWPTENYHYFSFTANGRDYGGNFRLHPEERERGLINFAYFDTADPGWFRHLLLGADQGVSVKQTGDLVYSVSFRGHEVLFALNAISQASPGAPLVLDQEQFIGRTFDESGLVFLLIYDPAIGRFAWVLDDNQPAATTLVAVSADLALHVASGFVFLQLPAQTRRFLVGVDSAQVVRNTYYDGPFDQLPDNWLADTDFQRFAEQMDPALKGQINSRGEFEGGASRLAIMPYLQYRDLTEVWRTVRRCEAMAQGNPALLACIIDSAQ